MRTTALDEPTLRPDVLRRAWGWYLALGVALVVLGAFALSASFVSTLAAMLAFGWALIFGGALTIAHAFWRREWGGFLLDLATGVLYGGVGLIAITNPLRSAVALTLLVAALLVVGGAFRVLAAAAVRYPHWPWLMLNGIVSMVLGGFIWAQWPVSGLWVLGVFVGIDMLLHGVGLCALALAARKGRATTEPRRPSPREREAPIGAHPVP